MKKIITLSLVLASYASKAVIIMPVTNNSGSMSHKEAVALWVVLNFFLVLWLCVRYFIEFRNGIKHTSFWRRFFTEDWGYSGEDLNFPTYGLIAVNGLAILVSAAFFVSSLI